MNKLYLPAIALLVFFSCKKDDKVFDTPQLTSNIERKCAAEEVLQRQLAEDPTLRDRMNRIEELTARYMKTAKNTGGRTTALTIPVVVHVVYNTPEQNISDAQIAAQMQVLNEDFSASNNDIRKAPAEFSGYTADMAIQFTLAETRRVQTQKKSFGTEDGVKYSRRGGDDAIDASKYLNIWVCNLSQNLLGYAQFPGGKAETDGVVILYSSFGSRDKNKTGTYISNYDLGRTATHEIGHWVNLRHIWGDATCGTDYVGDTPPHKTSNGGCPATKVITCTSNSTTNPEGFKNEMTMNYMDYTYDRCMYMFTNGQKVRADAVFASGGPRAAMAATK